MSLKIITATVGEGGANIPPDAATVQYLLNCVPVSQGGPARELKIDGFAGVVTSEAIKRFQKVRFGLLESLVRSGGNTFGELKKFDPLPFSAPVVAPNLNPLASEKLNPSKMNRQMSSDRLNGMKKSIDGGGIKGRL